jgi:hypothetical protein
MVKGTVYTRCERFLDWLQGDTTEIIMFICWMVEYDMLTSFWGGNNLQNSKHSTDF